MPRAGLSPDAVVDLAVGHVDDHGPAALTLAAVAAARRRGRPLAVQARREPRRAAVAGLAAGQELTEQIAGAVIGRSGEQALRPTHGFAVLEAAGGLGFPEELDASYERLIHMITAGLRGR